MTLRYNQVVWGDRLCKQHVREHLTIVPYRDIFGVNALPPDLQYWSLCGQCTDSSGNIHPTSEIMQLVRSGMITENQYHGVDIDPEIIAHNKSAYPEGNWYCGELSNVLCTVNGFRPAVINIDSTSNPSKTFLLLADVLTMLHEEQRNNVMVSANTIVEFSRFNHNSYDVDQLANIFMNVPGIKSMRNHFDWQVYKNSVSVYESTVSTTMATIIFYRKQ